MSYSSSKADEGKKVTDKSKQSMEEEKGKNDSLSSLHTYSDYKLNNRSVLDDKEAGSVVSLSSKESKKEKEFNDSEYSPSEFKNRSFMKSSSSKDVSQMRAKYKGKGFKKNPNKINSGKTMKTKTHKSKVEDYRDCKICGKVFSRQGLGGHMSRAHPGQSDEYRQKKQTRNGRESKLRLLRKAQRVYRVVHKCPDIKGTDMNRTKLNKIRDHIKKWMLEHAGMEYDTSEEGAPF